MAGVSSQVVSRTVRVPESIDIELKKLAADLKLDKSELYEAGAVLVLAVRLEKRVPAELAKRVRQLSPKAAEVLVKIVTKR